MGDEISTGESPTRLESHQSTATNAAAAAWGGDGNKARTRDLTFAENSNTLNLDNCSPLLPLDEDIGMYISYMLLLCVYV